MTTRHDIELIRKIAERATALYEQHGREADHATVVMDLITVIDHGCPLHLDDMLHADASNFLHDIAGINRHLNRLTGKLEDCFLPRFARLC